jgi:threonine/homoserine/homoserine lactone efflux protein
MAFTGVKLIGAAYLFYVGLGMLFRRSHKAEESMAAPVRLPRTTIGQVFRQGFFTNVLNPKVALFFLAFVPQFIDPAAPHKALAFIVLGLVFNVNGMLWCNFLAWSAATASERLKGKSGRLAEMLNRATGGLFVALGVKLVLSRQN